MYCVSGDEPAACSHAPTGLKLHRKLTLCGVASGVFGCALCFRLSCGFLWYCAIRSDRCGESLLRAFAVALHASTQNAVE